MRIFLWSILTAAMLVGALSWPGIYPRIFRGTPGRVLAQLAVELPCPAGDAPAIFAGSVTRNPATDSVRYNFCVTSSGHLLYQGDGGGSVASVFGRTGAVVAANNDYSFSQISGVASTAQIGTGTPGASKYVDGATGAWTALPSSGVSTVYNTTASAAAASIGSTAMVTAPASDTNYSYGAFLSQTVATAGCSTQPSFQIEIIFTDAFTGASRTALPLVNQLGNGGTFNNAQSFAAALSVATSYTTHLTLRAKASTTVSYTVVYFAGVGCTTGASYSIAPVLVQE